MKVYRYPWPASRVDHRLMHLLHESSVRERPRRPITELIAEAVREKVERTIPFSANNHDPEAA